MHVTAKQCFSALDSNLYKEFLDTIIKKDNKIQRLWNSNDFIGFISLIEALLVKYEKQSQDKVAVEEGSTAA